jgi:nitric oxide reductase NorQ protein
MNGDVTPYYRGVGEEESIFRTAFEERLPLLLKGPTGCGKSRLVEAMAHALGRPLVTVSCHDETTATDLLGRYLVEGGDTVWHDGPVARAVRMGAILYLDEIAEARDDVVVVLHPLSDHRREVHLDRHDEVLRAGREFMLVASMNPGYQRGFKELKPSTRQRFVTIALGYPSAEVELEIVVRESGAATDVARRIVAVGQKIRKLESAELRETVSTRLLVQTAKLVRAGLPIRLACRVGLIEALTDEGRTAEGLATLVDLST